MKIQESIILTRQVDKQLRNKEEANTTKHKMSGITTYLSIITLNINGLNSPKKQDPTICCLHETHLLTQTQA
jgi:hypothetical protein